MDPSEKFGADGSVELGPKEDYFIFLEGEHLGTMLRKHLGVNAETGYTPLGRLRITVERLSETTEPGALPGSEP